MLVLFLDFVEFGNGNGIVILVLDVKVVGKVFGCEEVVVLNGMDLVDEVGNSNVLLFVFDMVDEVVFFGVVNG